MNLFRPTSVRTLALVQRELAHGRVAFLLGAGVDIQLAKDAGKTDGVPGWLKMIVNLCNMKDKEESLARDWPSEMALIARWRLGDRGFRDRLEGLFEVEALDPKKPFTSNLCALLRRSNLVVTTNYTSYIEKALRCSGEVVPVDREELGSFDFPRPGQYKDQGDRIYVVHLHGRTSGHSFPVLDAWGYNIVQNEDRNYEHFLEELFTHRTVISIGVS